MKKRKNIAGTAGNLSKNSTESDIILPKTVMVKFKGGRKEPYFNNKGIYLRNNEIVVVNATHGYDIGKVLFLAETITSKSDWNQKGIIPLEIIRKGNQLDFDRLKSMRSLEINALPKSRLLAKNLGLVMKITDIEFRGDLKYATFFYTAKNKVDFRELIVVLAREFKAKVHMRHISVYEEFCRLGTIGTCRKEYCLATWPSYRDTTEFRCCLSENLRRANQTSL